MYVAKALVELASGAVFFADPLEFWYEPGRLHPLSRIETTQPERFALEDAGAWRAQLDREGYVVIRDVASAP